MLNIRNVIQLLTIIRSDGMTPESRQENLLNSNRNNSREQLLTDTGFRIHGSALN